MEVVYAYCRAMDDVVDRAGAIPEEAQRELNRWRQELACSEAGFPTHPIAVALREVRRRYSIPMEYFEKLILGVEMDLHRRRYATFEELKLYCEHVASVVGLISVRIFGCRHPETDRYATCLGIALQLTNILRDLKEDAEQGRVYLPLEDLRRFGCSEQQVLEGRFSESLRAVMEFQTEKARNFFQQAAEALRMGGEEGRLLPARIMGRIYARLLQRIEDCGYDVFSRRVSIPIGEQCWMAGLCLFHL